MIKNAWLTIAILTSLLPIPKNNAAMPLSAIKVGQGSGILTKVIKEKPTNARATLEVIIDTMAELCKQKKFNETAEGVQNFLGWVSSTVEPNPQANSVFSDRPYFTRTDLDELYLCLEALRIFFETKLPSSYDRLDALFRDTKQLIEAKAPVKKSAVTDTASLKDKAIFKTDAVAFQARMLGSRTALTSATNARDVLSNVAALQGKLYGSLSTFSGAERLKNSTNSDDVSFLRNNTQGLFDSVKSYLDKLGKNVSIEASAASWYSRTAYFDKGNFNLLKSLLEVFKHFCVEKMCLDQEKTNQLFQNFYNKYQ